MRTVVEFGTGGVEMVRLGPASLRGLGHVTVNPLFSGEGTCGGEGEGKGEGEGECQGECEQEDEEGEEEDADGPAGSGSTDGTWCQSLGRGRDGNGYGDGDGRFPIPSNVTGKRSDDAGSRAIIASRFQSGDMDAHGTDTVGADWVCSDDGGPSVEGDADESKQAGAHMTARIARAL